MGSNAKDGNSSNLDYPADSIEIELCRVFIRSRLRQGFAFQFPGQGEPKEPALKAIQPWAKVFHQLLKSNSERELQEWMVFRSLGVSTPQELQQKIQTSEAAKNQVEPVADVLGREGFFKWVRSFKEKTHP